MYILKTTEDSKNIDRQTYTETDRSRQIPCVCGKYVSVDNKFSIREINHENASLIHICCYITR